MRLPLLAGAALILFLPWHDVAAQSDPRLLAIVRQAQEGKSDSARSTLSRMLATTPTADSLYPQVLYAIAVTAFDVTERERALQRIVVEFPLSSWTDDALLLLAESDYAGGNLPGAARDLERMRSDFPASPVLVNASLWAARTYFDMKNQPAACRWLTLGLGRPTIDIELRNRLAFQAQQCGGQVDTSTPRDTPRTQAPPVVAPPVTQPPVPQPPVTPPRDSTPVRADTAVSVRPAAHGFRVQLAAAASRAEAEGIVRGLSRRGVEADITAEKGYFKVRTGHYRTRAEAQAAVGRLKSQLGGAPFVAVE